MPLIGRGYRQFLDRIFSPRAGTAWPVSVRDHVQLVSPYMGLSSSLEQRILPDDLTAGWNMVGTTGGAGQEYVPCSYSVPEFHADYIWACVEHNDPVARNVQIQVVSPAGDGVSVGWALAIPTNLQFAYGPFWLPSRCTVQSRVQALAAGSRQILTVYNIRMPIGAV